VKPEPAKLMIEPVDPEVEESTKLGTTVNVGISGTTGVSKAAFPVTMIWIGPAPPREFAPTLNVPVNLPVEVFIEQVTSAGLMIRDAGVPETIVHPVESPTEKPVPETLTAAGLAGALGGPTIGGEPSNGLTVAAGRTVN
jgi:hypothetical protein